MDQPDQMAQLDLEALAGQLQKSIEELNSECDRNRQTLIDQIKDLNAITDELESMHKGTTIGSLVGSTVGAAGGIAALVGLALAPFTFGASLALTVGGAVAGVAGGVTSAASNITNMVLQKNLRETIQKITSDFLNTIEPIIQHLDKIKNTIEDLQQLEQTYSAQNKIILTSVKSFKTITKIVSTIGDVVANGAKIFKTVGKLSAIISAVLIPLDVYCIVHDSIEISEINQSESERKEEEIKSETLKCIHQMRKTAAVFQETLNEIECAKDIINKELKTR